MTPFFVSVVLVNGGHAIIDKSSISALMANKTYKVFLKGDPLPFEVTASSFFNLRAVIAVNVLEC